MGNGVDTTVKRQADRGERAPSIGALFMPV